MRHLASALLAAFLTTAALAQDPAGSPTKAAPPAATPAAMNETNQKALDLFLDLWEKRMQKLEGLETKIVLTEVIGTDKVIRTGDAAILKPNYAKILLKDQANPANVKKWRHFVADGKWLWEYDYAAKVARVEKLPDEGVGDNLLMAFLFMGKAANLKGRFDLSVDVSDPDKYTDNYLHIQIRPRRKEDMQEFEKAELVLWKNNKDPKLADRMMLPARLWFQSPNKDQMVWEFKELTTKGALKPAAFVAPGFPDKEWTREWRRPPVPTVSRSTGPGK
jgi:TIGR03009 family protein